MKLYSIKSERLQKWGLFCLLTGSLGFSLSMNPDHFNQIARYEHKTYSMDLAATQSETQAADNVLEKSAPEEKIAAAAKEGKKSKALSIRNIKGAQGTFNVTVLEVDQKTYAKFESEAKGDCDLCKSLQELKTSSLDQAVELGMEIRSLVDRESHRPQDSEDSGKVSKSERLSKKDEAKQKLTDLAARCKKKDKEERLSCHADQLATLSNKLDDSRESEDLLKKYFDTYILRALAEGFASRTTDPVTLAIDMTKLNEADQLARTLIEELSPDNSRIIISKLTKLKAGSYSSQINHARDMYFSAQSDKASKDMNTMGRGYNMERLALDSLNPSVLNSHLMMDWQNWNDAIESGDKGDYQNLLRMNIYDPVQRVIGQLGNVSLYSTNPQDLGTQLTQVSIPDLSGMNMSLPNMNSTFPHTAGLPGNIPNSIFLARSQAQLRGSSLPNLPFSPSIQSISQSPAPSWIDLSNSWLNNKSTQSFGPAPSFGQPQTRSGSFNPALINARTGNARQ